MPDQREIWSGISASPTRPFLTTGDLLAVLREEFREQFRHLWTALGAFDVVPKVPKPLVAELVSSRLVPEGIRYVRGDALAVVAG